MKPNTNCKSIKVEGEDRIDVTTDKIVINPGIDHMVGMETAIEAEGTMTETIDQIKEVDQEITTGKMIGEITTDRTIVGITIEVTTDRTMDTIITENRGIEIEVKVGTIAEITMEII